MDFHSASQSVIEVDIMTDMEVDMVADMEVDMVATMVTDMEVDMVDHHWWWLT